MNLLIVDDENSILATLEMSLKEKHNVFKISHPNEIKSNIEKHKVDILISEFNFGESKIIHFIKDFLEVPTIIMTGKASRSEILELIDIGIKNFIEKPINIIELNQKIENLSKTTKLFKDLINSLNIEINFEENSVLLNQKDVKLTPSEYRLLNIFLKNNNRPLSRKEIEFLIWENLSVSKNTLDTHLYNLKKKIPILDKKIYSLYGKGFVFKIEG